MPYKISRGFSGILMLWTDRLSAAFELMQNWALLAVLRNMRAGWMRTCHVFLHSLLLVAASFWFPLPFLCLQQVCAISFPLFNWKCLIKYASIFFLILTQLSIIHKSLSLGLPFTCYLFMPAMCKLWRCSYKSMARHLDSCQEGSWFCLPTLALPAVLLNVHKTQPKPNKANIPKHPLFFWVLLYSKEEGIKFSV